MIVVHRLPVIYASLGSGHLLAALYTLTNKIAVCLHQVWDQRAQLSLQDVLSNRPSR